MESWSIFHFNDEEKQLHQYLAKRGHRNTILPPQADPFAVVDHQPFDAAFIGLHPHGLRLIPQLHRQNPDCLVTIITSDRNTRMAVEAMKTGAFDYLLSPLDFTEVDRSYILLSRERLVQEERRKLRDQLAAASEQTRLVGASEPIQNLRKLITKAARTGAPALITGETGTGKELIARLLHEQGPRAEKPFLAINCNAVPQALLESELFGYKKGAFTGADADHLGLLAEADGGTFLFDEVQDLDLRLQGKLLRVLQENEIQPLGSRGAKKINVRFISATNQDLPALVEQRLFRRDLFYRLNVIPIHVPPLRQRTDDIAILARYFIDLYARREAREPLKISPAVWRWMNAYPWPGNIRELENLCQRAVALTDGDTFDADLLSLTGTRPADPHATPAIVQAGSRWAHSDLDRRLLQAALTEHAGNVSRAAAALSISRTTFYAKARKLNVPLPRG